MNKSIGFIIAFAFSLIAHSTLAGEVGGLVEPSTTFKDRLKLSILPGLRQPSHPSYSFSFASPMRLNSAFLSQYAARDKQRASDPYDSFPVEQPANNLMNFKF